MRSGFPVRPYVANLRRLGYADDELDGGPSDRIIDAVFACGDQTVIATRVREHLDAGADHVVLQPAGADLPGLLDQLEHITVDGRSALSRPGGHMTRITVQNDDRADSAH